jgi:diguanylate cyclase (GGDEF)-like protein
MHKPSKFGDNLTNIRKDFKYVNNTKKPIRGFVQGRTTHGLRNVYPIINKKGKHLGAFEISFSSDSIQDYLTNVSKIHTHFLVKKEIFDAKIWKRDDLMLKYFQSSEHKDFMLAMNKEHTTKLCIVENKKKLQSNRKDINQGILKGEKFSIYTLHDTTYKDKHTNNKDEHVDVVTFYPIKDIFNEETLAWLVSYEESKFIYSALEETTKRRIIFFLAFLVIIYLLFKQIKIQEIIKLDHILLNNVLNSTDNIMFVTNFHNVTFVNRKFKDFFNINSIDEFSSLVDNDLMNIFIAVDGYLHHELLKDNENLFQLIKRTTHENRIVCILDKTINTKAFYINMTQVYYGDNNEYLVTLTDITKFKEKEIQIEKKAYIDGLTQVYNRNKFDEIMSKELLKNNKDNLSIAILDIDHFKQFNDKYGHLIGDEVLIMLAHNVDNNVKKLDTFARWGGEEFVILFPNTSKENAKIVCNHLREDIEKYLTILLLHSHLKAKF